MFDRLIRALERVNAFTQHVGRAFRRYHAVRCNWRQAWFMAAR